jgi:predicted transcriptional regulator of viral defense system
LLYNYPMNAQSYTRYKKVFAENNGTLRAVTATELGVPRHVIYKMVETGDLVREAQGIYRLNGSEPLSSPDLVQVSLRVPRGVVCLLSALYQHNLTTQIPHQVHIALPRDVKTPKIDYPPLRVFHYSQASYQAGIVDEVIDGVRVKIYNREKTIADCFKFREKIGMDVAIESLKDYFGQPRPNAQMLIEFARLNRVENILRPYLEVLI